MRLITLFLLLMLLTGCGRKKTPGKQIKEAVREAEITKEITLTSARGGTLIRSVRADAVVLNPIIESSTGGVGHLVYSRLVRINESIEPEPDLAESWNVSDDNLEITFHLRDDVLWHDGLPFTAADVKFTYDSIMDPSVDTYHREQFEAVSKVEILDDFTLRITYSKIFAPAFSSWSIPIIPRHVYKNKNLNTTPYNNQPIGTGPFRFVQWSPQSQIVFEANDAYYNGRPYLDMIISKVMPDASMSFVSLLRGDVDSMPLIPDQYVKQASNEKFTSQYTVIRKPSRSVCAMMLNMNDEILSDLRVRKALTHGLDREQILREVLHGFGSTITGPHPPNYWSYNNDLKPYEYSPEKAGELLDQAGWTMGDSGYREKQGKELKFECLFEASSKLGMLTSAILTDCWKKIGVKTKITFIEWGVICSLADKRDFRIMFMGVGHSYDPDYYNGWHSSMIYDPKRTGTGSNHCAFSHPEVDELLEKGRSTLDISERKACYQRIHEILYQQCPKIWLFNYDHITAVSKRFRNTDQRLEHWCVPLELRKY